MVTGSAALHARIAAVPEIVREEVTKAIAKVCNEIVRDMKALAPFPEMAAGIAWTWVDAPAGTMKVASFDGKDYAKIGATIYVDPRTSKYPDGRPILANWFEFGTNLRIQKKTGKQTGRIVAQPFFWPAVRTGKKTFNSRMNAAIKRAIVRANKA